MFSSSPVLEALSGPFKRAQFGLFQGKSKQYGNNVPFSKHKTRRTWLPNVQHKYLFSETLGQEVRLKITTRALKTIKKYGGLDNYVLNTRADLLAWEGMRVRLLVQQKLAERQREEKTHPTESTSTLEPGSELSGDTPANLTAPNVERSDIPLQPALDSVDITTAEPQTAEAEPTETVKAEAVVGGAVTSTKSVPIPEPSPKRTKGLTSDARRQAQIARSAQIAQQNYERFLLGNRPKLADARRLRQEAERILSRSDALTTIAYLQSKEIARQQYLQS